MVCVTPFSQTSKLQVFALLRFLREMVAQFWDQFEAEVAFVEFKAHPKEEFMNHSLATAQARAQRASNPGPPD